MSSYKIGLYNPNIEDANGLEDCERVFKSYEKLKAHVRDRDTIILKSAFSVFDVGTNEIIKFIDEYNLKVIVLGENEEKDEHTNYNNLQVTTLIAINKYIKDNLELIKKL